MCYNLWLSIKHQIKIMRKEKNQEDKVGSKELAEQPGNLNALKHGFYSKHFQKSELTDVEEIGDLQEEIQMMRVVTRRLLQVARECADVTELSSLLNTLGLASTRLAGLMKTQKLLEGTADNALEEISAAVDDLLKDWGWR